MNQERIQPSIDVARMGNSHVTIVGGAYGLGASLVRSGLGAATPVDFASVSPTNPSRQDLPSTDIGLPKIESVARSFLAINPEFETEVFLADFCTIPPDEFDARFGHTDLFIYAADQFAPQARGNIEAIRLGKPAIWIGLYAGGRAGEIVYWVPGQTEACYRCICSSRYDAFSQGLRSPGSVGGTIHDLHLVDAIAGHIAVGILTRGAQNRFGTLIEKLGNRSLLQVKIDPDYTMGGKDIFARHLGTSPANFTFSTIALPMEREEGCPDCGHLHEERVA